MNQWPSSEHWPSAKLPREPTTPSSFHTHALHSLTEDVSQYLEDAFAEIRHGVAVQAAVVQVLLHIERRLLDALSEVDSSAVDENPMLTNRQRIVLELLRDGLRPSDIAQRLSLATSSVRTYIRDACKRLDASGAYEAVLIAEQRGLIRHPRGSRPRLDATRSYENKAHVARNDPKIGARIS